MLAEAGEFDVQVSTWYKRLMMSLAPDLDPEGYNAAISNLHNYWAQVGGEGPCCAATTAQLLPMTEGAVQVLWVCRAG